ncbi:hypothetical protein V6N13_046894 [Hibiscus sabdariffa]
MYNQGSRSRRLSFLNTASQHAMQSVTRTYSEFSLLLCGELTECEEDEVFQFLPITESASKKHKQRKPKSWI